MLSLCLRLFYTGILGHSLRFNSSELEQMIFPMFKSMVFLIEDYKILQQLSQEKVLVAMCMSLLFMTESYMLLQQLKLAKWNGSL